MTVRRLGPEDATLWKAIRLSMLAEAPDAFASTLADWADRPHTDWEALLGRNRYVAGFDGGRAVGAMGLCRSEPPSTGHRGTLIAAWLDPAARGTGLATAMLDEIVSIACEVGMTELELQVTAGNARAVRFYERAGFLTTGYVPRAILRDGNYLDEVLMLRRLDA